MFRLNKTSSVCLTVALFFICWLFLFWPTFTLTVNTWDTSDTYGHGYLIPVLSVYFIWLKRFELFNAEIKPFYWSMPVIVGLGFIWLIGEISYTNVIQQFAIFLLPFFASLLVFGLQVTRILAFPLLFLIFCVPFGEGLIPVLQVITAEITIYFIKLIGLPVYVDGLFITLTSGIFEVAKACSGISYLIASLAVGSFYAFITYKSAKKRILFMLFSLFVPIVANGLRALIIVLLAHYSDLAIATGFDHLVYGWIFFGLIIFIMFSVGGRWADQGVFKDEKWSNEQKPSSDYRFNSIAVLLLVAPLVLVSLYSNYLEELPEKKWQSEHLLTALPSWKLKNNSDNLSAFAQANLLQSSTFKQANTIIDFYGAYFEKETRENEFISYKNQVYDGEKWALDISESIEISGQSFHRYEVVNSFGLRKQLIFAYKIGDRFYTSPMLVKLAMLENKLLNGDSSALYVAFSSTYQYKSKQQRAELITFINQHLEQLL